MSYRKITTLLLFCLATIAFAKKKEKPEQLILWDGPFDLAIAQTSSTGEVKTGFGKGESAYWVRATNTHMEYVLYCRGSAPEVGRTYKASENFVDGHYSPFHSWPVERKNIPVKELSPTGPTMYRLVIIEDVFNGPRSSLGCDVHSETPIKALPRS